MNMEEFRQLEGNMTEARLSRDELVLRLQMNAKKSSELMIENNNFIENHIRPLFANHETLSEGTAQELFEFSQKLYSFSSQLDMGLALEIHIGLLKWARACGDELNIIRGCYHAGFIYQQINSRMINQCRDYSFFQPALDMFEEGAGYRHKYFDIKSKEARMHINRCMGNVYVILGSRRHEYYEDASRDFFEKVDDTIKFWNDAAVRELDPDFKWQGFISNAHQNIIAFDDILRKQPLDNFDENLAKRVCESFDFLASEDSSIDINRFWPHTRTEYAQLITSFYKGKTDYDGVLNGLRRMFAQTRDDDYTGEGLYGMSYIALMLMQRLQESELAGCSKKEIDDIVSRITRYCQNAPNGADRRSMNEFVAIYSKSVRRNVFNFDEYLDLLLKFTSFSHFATYVHSLQVRNLVLILAEYFMCKNPEAFVGFYGTKNADEVIALKSEIIHIAGKAALCHDVGKVSFFNTISLCSRRLYDFEYEDIKAHTVVNGFFETDDERVKCVASAAIGHHKWYDGKGGYPAEFDANACGNKFILDMISAADSIDAATDFVGRSYASGVSLEQVINEINDQAGTRYSPIVAEALRDEALVSKIRECITEGRENVYYEVYLAIAGRGAVA